VQNVQRGAHQCRPRRALLRPSLAFTAPRLAQVAAACRHTGFFAVRGHGCSPTAIADVMRHGRAFFDKSGKFKDAHVVDSMRVGRGYEVSLEHRPYEAQVVRRCAECPEAGAAVRGHAEPSVRQGRMSERFLCGPQGVPAPRPSASAEERDLDQMCGTLSCRDAGCVTFGSCFLRAAPDRSERRMEQDCSM
jgi:isopenicillin N synthase-like dioxygenase